MGTRMKPRRVLILYENSLLAEGLLLLLSEQNWLNVRAQKLSDHGAGSADDFVPDVIIVDREDFARASANTVQELLSKRPSVRIVDVSSDDDLARVYDGHQIRVAKFDDFLATLAGKGRSKLGG